MTTTANPAEVDHLRDRVRLYLQVLLIIDVGSRISDALSPFFIQDLVYPDWPLSARILRWAVTAVVAAGWLFARFAKPNRLALTRERVGSKDVCSCRVRRSFLILCLC
jgi:hypothetical protein